MITFASASEASTLILSKPIKMYNKHKLRNKPSQCARWRSHATKTNHTKQLQCARCARKP